VAHGPYTLEAGRDGARRLLGARPRPTALLAAGNVLTAGALETLAEMGLAIPDDVALIGFGPAPRSTLERPDLTMVGLPGEAMGDHAGRLLLRRIAQGTAGSATAAAAAVVATPTRERLPVQLLLGRSCGCPRSAPDGRP
jgi:DNA-binding LacI/PurR family transcriptional regulator